MWKVDLFSFDKLKILIFKSRASQDGNENTKKIIFVFFIIPLQMEQWHIGYITSFFL